MPEVLEVSDRIEVLRLGQRVAQFKTTETTMEDVVGAMTGAVDQRGGGSMTDADHRRAADDPQDGRTATRTRRG